MNIVNARPSGGCPIIGNNVEIGANSVITRNISIIAVGSVVVKDIPSKVIVAGNPASIVKYLK